VWRHGFRLVCLILSGLLFSGPATGADPFTYPAGTFGKGELKHINGLPVLIVAGGPEEIGEAVGALALHPAEKLTSYADDLLDHYHVSFLRPSFVSAGRKMVARFPEDYRREFETMVRAAQVDRARAVLGNTLFDLKKILACSALLVEPGRSVTNTPLLGRNLDYPSLGYAHEFGLVTVYRPTGKHAFAAVGFPGLIGCLSGMNDAGLAVAVLEVFHIHTGHVRFNHAGMPYALCYRRLLEQCTTVAEAKALLESLPRTTITNLVVADRQSVAVFEVTPRQVVLRAPGNGTQVCTNHFCTDELRTLWHHNSYRTYDRYRALQGVAEAHDKLGLDDLHQALDAAHQDGETMQTMVFEPATLRLHLSIGTCPSTAAEMKLLELGPLLEQAAGDR
jgi:isopenicillin-N N-acyltransferase-like protein